MQIQNIQNNNYNTHFNTPRFCGTANLKKLRQFVSVAEPKALEDVIKGNFDEYVKWWIKTPDKELEKRFGYSNLNLYLMQKNIRVLLDKRGAFYYDISDLLTEDNYVEAFYAIRDPYMNLHRMRAMLRSINETPRINKRICSEINSENADEQIEQSVKRDKNWFIAYVKSKIFSNRFCTSDLDNYDIRNLTEIIGTTEEHIKKMDKQEYRKLSMKFHPDVGGNEDIFCIINRLYHCANRM